MNIRERRNLRYRLISGILLVLSTILMVFSLIAVIKGDSENKFLPVLAIGLTIFFALAEGIFIIWGRKKEIIIKSIAFDESNRPNNLFLIAVIIGTLFASALLITCSIIFFTKEGEPYFTSSLVIICIGTYLFINCLIYYLYLFMFRKQKLDAFDLSK